MKANSLILTAVLIMCCAVMSKAENPNAIKVEYETGKYMYFILNSVKQTASVTWGGQSAFSGTPDYTGEISIPSSITYDNMSYDVTSIGDNAFRRCTNPTSISIPDGCSVGKYALSDFTGTIIVEGSVKDVGASAFNNCTGLESITISGSIEEYAFAGCTNLKSITLKDGCSVGNNGLSGFTGTINIGGSVKDVGASAFKNCTGLKSITVSGRIGASAFSGCTNLESITLKDGCSVSDDGLSGFTGTINIEGSVKDVGARAFKDCTGLKSISVSGSIGGNAFYGCENLESITLKDGCSVGYYGLPGFTGTINIEGSVKDVGESAFKDCTGLKSITVSGRIGAIAFSGCTNLKSITLKDGCSVGDNGLSGFTGTINIEGSVKDVGARAFENCTGLTSLTISDNVTSIGQKALYGCTGLTFLYVKPTTPPTVGSDAFNAIPNDIPVYVPDAYAYIKSDWAVYFTNIVSDTEAPKEGPAIKVTRNGKTTILYNVEKVEFIKVTDNTGNK